MARGKLGFFPSAALLGVFAAFIGVSSATAQTVSGDPAGGTDELAPGPVANLSATVDLVETSVTLEWDLADDDFVRQTAAGGDFTSGGVFISANDVAGYDIWRSQLGGEFELIDTADAGATSYVDATVINGVTYIYQVQAVDGSGNASAAVESDPQSLGPPPSSEQTVPEAALLSQEVVVVFTGEAPATEEEEEALIDQVTDLLASLLNIDPARIVITAIFSGSIVVEFDILPAEDGSGEASAEEALAALADIIENDPEALSDIGPVESIAASTGGSLDLGNVAADTAVESDPFSFSNTSDEADAVLSVTASVDADGFSVSADALILQQGEEGEITVSFDAAAVNNLNGDYSTTLTILTNDPANSSTVLEVSAAIEGGLDDQEISLSTTALDFNRVGTGESRTRTLTISNVGGLELSGEAAISGDPEFSLGSSVFIIPGGGSSSFDIDVTFAPTSDRPFSGTVTITSNDPNNPELTVSLSGLGVSGIEELQDEDGNPILGDIDGSAGVDFDDFFLFADNFGQADFDPAADLDSDGDVDFDDFFLFADNFGKSGEYVTLGTQATSFTSTVDEAQAGGTGSAGSGSGTGTLNADESEFSFSFTVSGLADVTAVHFHNAAAGENGGVVRDLANELTDNGDGTWTIAGTWAATDDQPLLADELKAGNVYINVHTTAEPAGEIRGQVLSE